MKRVLFLGGAYYQIPIIREAKKRGYYIITCDYLPNNPGHKLADEYYNLDTTDFKGVLNLAKNVKPDYVISYATDTAVETAAYVSEKLGLPGNSVISIRILTNKDLFRNFQKKYNFNTPRMSIILQNDNLVEKVKELKYPIIIKPSDSSGSKGISVIQEYSELRSAIKLALTFSRNKRVVAEEFIECDGEQLQGDGFIKDGNLIFTYLGDQHFNKNLNPLAPFSTTWPSVKPAKTIKIVEDEVSRLIKKSGFVNGAVNIEVRINKEGKIYIVEIGPRSGGNFVPQVINYATGFDMVKATLDVLSNNKIKINQGRNNFCMYYIVNTDKEGKLEKLSIEDELKPFIKEFHHYKHKGDKIESCQNSGTVIGLIILQFNNRNSMDFYISRMEKYVKIKIR